MSRGRRTGLALEVALWATAALLLTVGHGLGRPRAAPFEPGPRTAGAYRVVSWNVGGHASGATHPLPDESMPHVVERLGALEPDLVFLQEVRGRSQMRALLRALGAGWEGAIAPGGGPRVAAFARAGTFSFFEVHGLEVRGRRRASLGVEHDLAGRRVTAVGVHLDAFSAELRNEALGEATDALVERAAGGPRILAGDLNVDLDLDQRRDLFTDDEHLDVETYNYVANVLVDAGLGGGATAEPDRRLDYVFCDAASFRVLAAGPWKGQRAEGMDHDPIVADLAWR